MKDFFGRVQDCLTTGPSRIELRIMCVRTLVRILCQLSRNPRSDVPDLNSSSERAGKPKNYPIDLRDMLPTGPTGVSECLPRA